MPTLPAKREDVDEFGVPLPVRPPVDMPSVPYDLGELGDDDLMNDYMALVGWANYLAVVAASEEAAEEDAEEALANAKSLFMIRAADEGLKANDATRAARDSDPDVREAASALRIARARRKRIFTHLGTAERSAAALSRELTRRTSFAGQQGRAGKYGG